MSSEASPSDTKPKTLLVWSNKTPEEARIFGLRGSDIIEIREPTEEVEPALPDEWGLTSSNQDGVCKYCQLMLHPTAPKVTMHQPNVQSLITSGESCPVCKWLEISIVRGSPQLASRYSQGDPVLCDPSDTTTRITISLLRAPKYTRIVPVVGPRRPQRHFVDSGVPLISSTVSQLGDLASRRFWQRHDKSDSLPHERLKMLKTWLSECLNHENCTASLSKNNNSKLPTRVLDLTGSKDVPSSAEDIVIKLRETSAEETGSYTALSYIRGADPEHDFKTTQKTLDEYKRGIDYGSLSLTQREAILATLYLGIRFLWIDSICTVQDSPEECQAEAARVGSVYSEALLTLAATSASSPQDGLLNPFQAAKYIDLHGETIMIRLETHETIDSPSEPLNNSGWKLQESALSSRLVCFGSEQWLWKCPSRFSTEDGFVDRTPQAGDNGLNQWVGIAQQGPGEDGRNYFKYWYKVVSNYSARSLTPQSDKLKAISGLVDAFASHTGYQYVAGLWAEDVAVGLIWNATSRGVIRSPGSIPSWSWASVEGAVLPNDVRDAVSKLKLIDVEQRWGGSPLYSDLEVSHLTVSGMMIPLTLGPRSVTQNLRYHLIAAPGSEEIVGEGFLDNKDPIEQGISTIWCLLVCSTPSGGTEMEHSVLLLTPALSEGDAKESKIPAYRRVGMGIVWKKSRFADGRDEGKEAFVEGSEAKIVLV